MKVIYQDLPPVEVAGRKLVGRVLFGLLVLVAALVGATVGLLLVYSKIFLRSSSWNIIVPVRSPNCMTGRAASLARSHCRDV